MGELLRENRGLAIAMIVGGLLLVSGSVWASTAGLGVDQAPPEEQRRESVRYRGPAVAGGKVGLYRR